MEFTNTLKELYQEEIIEVRGNSDALAITLKDGVNIKEFTKKLKDKFKNLDETQKLFLKNESEEHVTLVVLE
ncbi:hypothetical protein [Pedobacter mucosus]|uniref:hypothetical protein n=1 Tax=Pedobacter mucosus TaxID=2895286 RepID=UPI001EE3C23F|nr:hypothetical protein [Pedobacter mucosus]UKT64196.1 hypothetical protein LOK61_00115 [Pedobacter mucosus]